MFYLDSEFCPCFPQHRFLLAPFCRSCECTNTGRPLLLSVETWISSSKAATAFPRARLFPGHGFSQARLFPGTAFPRHGFSQARPAGRCCISRSQRRGWHRWGDSCGVHAPCLTQPISGVSTPACGGMAGRKGRKGLLPRPPSLSAGGQGAAPARPWRILLHRSPAAACRSSS